MADPHGGQPILTAGRPLEDAAAAVLMVHGRGATADGMLQLAAVLGREDVCYLAPQAAGGTWYPYAFLAPVERNEPHLGSALRRLESVVEEVLGAGIPPERLLLLGFSQGACLTAEYVARHPRRYGGVAVLTGGLIGPDGSSRDYPGSLDGTPVFLGTADPDPHVPVERVEETARVLGRMGARVTTRVYPGLGHTIAADELEHVGAMLDGVAAAPE